MSGSRPGYSLMRWSRSSSLMVGVVLLGVAGYSVHQLVSGGVEDPGYMGAPFSTLLFASLGGVLVYRALGATETDSVELQSYNLAVSTPKWTGTIGAHEVSKVRQVHGNPYNAREWPLRSWRHWIRFDLDGRGDRGFRTLYVWTQEPVGFLQAVERAGFPVQGKLLEP